MPSKLAFVPALCLVCLTSLILSGCGRLGVSNPFAVASDVKEVSYREFTDIPVPEEMKSVPSGTMVTSAQDGIKVGVETFKGRVEAASLANAMIHNMAGQGWSLRASITGRRTLQVHEKENRFAVIVVYAQAIRTGMEVWVLNRLSAGDLAALPYAGGGGGQPASAARAGQTGGVTSHSLSD